MSKLLVPMTYAEKLEQELIQVTAQRDRARSSLAKTITRFEERIESIGGCDHSIGVCYCDDYAVIDKGMSALK